MCSSVRSLAEFKDIIGERFKSSDIFWVSREWKPSPSYQNAKRKAPEEVKLDIITSPRIQHVIDELVEELKTSKALLYKEVDGILDEMGHRQQLPVIRWFGYFLTKVMKRLYSGIFINEPSIEKMRAVMRDSPVVLVPSHRSYADFLLLSYICFHFNVMLPVIAAGMDFVSMWGIGRMLRDSGAFFIRRSFGNDKLYWAAFSEYVQYLVKYGDSPVEFFIEGTRSRSAKSLTPKFGFLSVALECFFSGEVPDVILVPVNISYDRTLEEVLYAYELLGVPKPRESTSGLLKALRMLDEQYGRIHVDFAEPISARQFCASVGYCDHHRAIRAASHNLSLPRPQSPYESKAVSYLAYHLVRQQQFHAVLSPFSIISLVLSNHLALSATNLKQGEMKLCELVHEVKWIQSVIETLGALVDIRGEVEAVVLDALAVHKSLIQLTPADTIQLVQVHSQSMKINSSKLKGHEMSQNTLEVAVSMVMLQHYVNQVLHHLINPAIVSMSMWRLDEGEAIEKGELFAKYQFMRTLLSFDFILHKSWEVKDFEEAVKQLDLLNIVEEIVPNKLILGNHKKLQVLMCNLILPFLTSHSVVCHVVEEVAEKWCAGSTIVKASQKRMEELLLSGSTFQPQALSLDGFNSAVSSLVNVGGLSKCRTNGEVKYQVNKENLKKVTHELSKYLQYPERKAFSRNGLASMYLAKQTERAKL